MNEQGDSFEQNLGRLLRASCGPEARVTPAERERLRQELASAFCARPKPTEFPGVVLGILTCLVLLFGGAWGVAVWVGGAGLPGGSPGAPFAALVVVNLLAIPVASVVIILRRKSCQYA